MVFISVMVWICFYPGNRLHAVSLKVGLVMDDFGMHDRSYNQLAYQGLVQAEKELGIKGSAVSAAKEEDYSKIIGRYVQGGYELVIGNGVLMKQAFIEASQRFPGTKFVLTDVELEGLPNLGSVVFASQEVSFLAGSLAAMLDQDQNARFPIRHNGRLSIVAGQEIPSVETSMAGFFQGARYINPYIQVRYGFAGSFKNADAGKQLALNQNINGSDIIYTLAGDAGSGVLAASNEAKFLIIGSGSDPDFSEANRVLTNTRKLYNVVVFQTVKDTLQGRFPSGKVIYDLKNGGVELTPLNRNVPEYISNRLEQIRDDIMNGWIRVGVEIPEWAKLQNQR